MKKANRIISLSVAGLILLGGCSRHHQKAQTVTTSALEKPAQVDMKELLEGGEKVYRRGTSSGAAGCATCHGANGEGQGIFPRLAHQGRDYIASALIAFQEGARSNAIMTPMAKALKKSEMVAVAAYIDQLPEAPAPKPASVSAAVYKRGRQLAEVGDAKLGLQSCNNCHGPGGTGEPPAIPALSGQTSAYLEEQLHSWKNGARKTSVGRMALIAEKLSDQDIKTVALYFEQVLSKQGSKH